MTVTVSTLATGPINVIKGFIDETLEGAWTATLDLDADANLVGPVVMDIDGITIWNGVQRRGAEEFGRVPTQLIGGAGKLSANLIARSYDTASILDILTDITVDAGEVISPLIDATILLAQVARWSRPTGAAGLSIKQVVDETTADHWRVRRDGLVWMGAETYPVVPPSFLFTEILREPEQGRIVIAPEDFQLLVAPGDNFEGRNVSSVRTVINGDGTTRQIISFEDQDGASVLDRKIGVLRRLVESFVGRRIDYSQMYPCTVNLQNADGSLDVTPDDDRIKGNGFRRVGITHGIPGVTVTVPIGGQVNLYFQNADPKKPRCALWEDGSSVTTVSVGTSADFVALAGKVLTELQAIKTAYDTHTHAGVTTGAGVTAVPIPPLTAPSSVASTVLKAK